MNAVAPLIPCIVSGGSGTRLWPVSRESMPKPFMRLADDQSLLQKTFLRIAGLPDVARLLTVTNRDLLFRTLDDYRAVNRSGLAQDLLLEPVGRNTAPAIAAAALHVQEHFGDQAQLLILPADHLIRDEQAFAAAVAEARGLAAQGYLVTFGITPERAETGFGYIEQGAPLGNGFRVARFVEKPDQATAQSYLDSGKYLWNAGMFCFQAATVLQELERHAPEVLIAARAALADGSSLENGQCRQRELAAGAFAEAPDISVDYALMERSDKVAVVPCSIGWSDIGSWQALRELSAADENGNQVRGESVLHDVSNCYIDSPKRLVGAVGVHDLIIVDTPTPCWWPTRRAARTSSSSPRNSSVAATTPSACTARSAGPGAPTPCSRKAAASRSSASWCAPRLRCRCRCTTIAASTGSWSAAWRWWKTASASFSSTPTNPPSSPPGIATA